MKQFFLIVFILCILSACKTDESDKIVDYDEISKPSEKYAGADSSGVKETLPPFYYDSISLFSQQLVDSLGYDKSKLFILDTLILPDRFGAQKTDKWYCLTGKDSLVFMHWEFKNITLTQNAFFNWLDCYGTACRSIVVGEKAKFSRRATLFLLQEKDLIFMESGQKINAEKILSVLSAMKKNKKWQNFVLQQPRGAAIWKYTDEEGNVKDPVVLESQKEM